MEAQHTPGPWSVFDHYCGRDPETAGEEYSATRLVGLGQFDTIAEVRHGHDEIAGDVDANARLIAAAPDLYAALTASIGFLLNAKIDLETGVTKATAIRTIEGGIKAARAALAKATPSTSSTGDA